MWTPTLTVNPVSKNDTEGLGCGFRQTFNRSTCLQVLCRVTVKPASSKERSSLCEVTFTGECGPVTFASQFSENFSCMPLYNAVPLATMYGADPYAK
eukprot:gene299-biopygen308